MSRLPRTGALLLGSFDGKVPAGGAVSVVELQRQVLLAFGWSWKRAASGPVFAQDAFCVEAWCPRRPRSENPLPAH